MEYVELAKLLVPGFIASILAYFLGKRKNVAEAKKLDADAAAVISAAAAAMIDPLVSRVRELQEESKELAAKLDKVTKENIMLKEKITLLEHKVATFASIGAVVVNSLDNKE